MPEATPAPNNPGGTSGSARSIQLTPELVKKIAARVYALMLADIKIERERQHFSGQKTRYPQGGQHGK